MGTQNFAICVRGISPEIQHHEETCAICLDEMLDDDKKKTPCDHNFHLHCILNWLNEKGDCPLCREKLRAVNGKILRDSRQMILVFNISPVERSVIEQHVQSRFGEAMGMMKRLLYVLTLYIYFCGYVIAALVMLALEFTATLHKNNLFTISEYLGLVSLLFYFAGVSLICRSSGQRRFPGILTEGGLVGEMSTFIAWIFLILALSLFQFNELF